MRSLRAVFLAGPVSLALAIWPGAAWPDDREAIFRDQMAQYAVIIHDSQGVARCGLRSGEWAMKVFITAAKAAAQIRNNLWPHGGEVASRSFKTAMAAFQAASDRGDAVPASWCTRPGMGQYLDALDVLTTPGR